MNSPNSNIQVINGMTKSNWLGLVREAMEQRRRIVLLLETFDPGHETELVQLCQSNHYTPPSTVTEEHWNELRVQLDLTEMAAKEQGVNRSRVFLIEPAG
jgi:hypothetical protein